MRVLFFRITSQDHTLRLNSRKINIVAMKRTECCGVHKQLAVYNKYQPNKKNKNKLIESC